MSLNIALVGCGKIADAHVEEIQKLGDHARVTSVCDLEPLMAEQVAVRYGIQNTYDNFERLLEREKPDVVHITTSPQSHLPLALLAFDAGCHVLLEKPLTLRHADTETLIDTAIRLERKLTVNWSYQFLPAARRMREQVAAGALGEPVHIESFMGYNLAGPFGAAIMSDPENWVHRLPGKLFQNNIDHLLSKVVEFLDEGEMPRIDAHAYVRREERFGDVRDEMEDELRVVLQGRRTSAYCTFSSHARPTAQYVRVYGTKNTLLVDIEKNTLTFDASTKVPSALGRLLPAFMQGRSYLREGMGNVRRFLRSDFHFFGGMGYLISQFYASIREDSKPPIPYRQMRTVSAMMEEIFRQIGQDRP